MPKFYFSSSKRKGHIVTFDGEEFHHMFHVHRLCAGDQIEALDGEGNSYSLRILKIQNRVAETEILEIRKLEGESDLKITMCQAIPRKRGMDFIIQKGTELGVNEFIPLITSRTVVKLDTEVMLHHKNRWQEIARESAKQCGRSRVPQVENPVNLLNMQLKPGNNSFKFVLHEKAATPFSDLVKEFRNNSSITVVIGPEGGFEDAEIEYLATQGYRISRFGTRILRTETAGLVVVSVLQYLFGDLGK